MGAEPTTVAESFVNVTTPHTATNFATLCFQTPTVKVIKSEKEKQEELESDIIAKEAPYKLTAQYAESMAAFLPSLINSMVSVRINEEQNKFTYNMTKYLIQNIY